MQMPYYLVGTVAELVAHRLNPLLALPSEGDEHSLEDPRLLGMLLVVVQILDNVHTSSTVPLPELLSATDSMVTATAAMNGEVPSSRSNIGIILKTLTDPDQ
eukprot:gene7357-16993_t